MRCDLHIHSCLSPCADEDMTPYNLVAMAALKGLDLIALTDHNTARNCPAAAEVAAFVAAAVVEAVPAVVAEPGEPPAQAPRRESSIATQSRALRILARFMCLPPINKNHRFYGYIRHL